MKRILFTYYTQTGSTKEVIETMAHYFSENGTNCTVLPFSEVTAVINYDLVVMGAPINGFNYVPEAQAFINAYQSELCTVKCAAFTLSYLSHYARPFFRNMIRNNFEKTVAPIRPLQTAVFGGLSNGSLPGVVRFLFGVPKEMPLDTRDFTAIDVWTKELHKKL